jgi:Zn-dependent peptidase ImmA (M78 family)
MMQGHDEPKRAMAVAEAAYLWKLYGFKSPRELVLEDLAFSLGVVVLEAPLSGMDARLVRGKKRGLIRVKADIPELGRKRFAAAHEIGHWRMHAKISQILACTAQDMVARYKSSPPEIEANYFAAELLMPEFLFGPRTFNVYPSAERVRELADEFQTSLTATVRRFCDLSKDYCAVVLSEAGKVKWVRASAQLEPFMGREPGEQLPANSVAADVFAKRSFSTEPHSLDASVWLRTVDDLETDEVFEQVIPQPAYNSVLSLLWIP